MMRVIPKWKIYASGPTGRQFEIFMNSDFPSEVLAVAAKLSYNPDVMAVTIIREDFEAKVNK